MTNKLLVELDRPEWSKNRIRSMVKMHGRSMLTEDAAIMLVEMACKELTTYYEERIAAIEMAASRSTNDLVAELLTLRAESKRLQDGNQIDHS